MNMSEKHIHKSDKDQLIKQAEEAFESAKERGWVGLTEDDMLELDRKYYPRTFRKRRMNTVEDLRSEINRMTVEMAKTKADMRFLRMFVAALIHPEEYGHAIPQEVRERARFVLKETEWVGKQ